MNHVHIVCMYFGEKTIMIYYNYEAHLKYLMWVMTAHLLFVMQEPHSYSLVQEKKDVTVSHE